MHLFGALGSFTFLTGFVIVILLIIARLREGARFGLTNKVGFYLALAAMIMGTLFFLTGFIAELVVRNAADRNMYLTDERKGWENN